MQHPMYVSQQKLSRIAKAVGSANAISINFIYIYVTFFRITRYNVHAHNPTYAHSPLRTHVCKLYSYEHFRRTEPTDLEIYEVTTGASLLIGMSRTTESIAPLNSDQENVSTRAKSGI